MGNQIINLPSLGDIDQIENDIIALKESDKAQNTNLANLNSVVANQTNSINSLKNITSQHTSQITDIRSDVSDLINEILALENTTTNNSNSITTLQNKDTQQDAMLANTYTKEQTYDKAEVDSLVQALPMGMIPKSGVQTYQDLSVFYPNPEPNWAVQVINDNTIYVYTTDGTPMWVPFYFNVIPLATDTQNGLFSSQNYIDLYNAISKNNSQDASLATQSASLQQLNTLTNSHTDSISALNTGLAGANSGIANLVISDNNQTTNINSLQTTSALNSNDISILKGQVADVYSKSYIDSNFYTQTQIQNTYYTKTQIDSNLATNYYDIPYINANYYDRSYIDNAFYDKASIDNNFYNKSETYDSATIDSKFNNLPLGMIPKTGVQTFEDLAIAYPDPQKNWAAEVIGESTIYVYSTDSTPMWVPFYVNNIPLATDTQNGLLSSLDFIKLQQAITDNATQTQHLLLLNSEIASLSGQINALDTTIAGLQTQTSNNTNAISTINSQMSSFYTKSYIDSNFYNKNYINTSYYDKAFIDANFYNKSFIDSQNYVQMSYLTANYPTTLQMDAAIATSVNNLLAPDQLSFLESVTAGAFTAVNSLASSSVPINTFYLLSFNNINNSTYLQEKTGASSGDTFKIRTTGKYNIDLNFNLSTTSNSDVVLYLFAEVSSDNGATWSNSTARKIAFNRSGDSYMNFALNTYILSADTLFRLRLFNPSSIGVNLKTESLSVPTETSTSTIVVNAIEFKVKI